MRRLTELTMSETNTMSHSPSRESETDVDLPKISGATRDAILTQCQCGAPIWLGWDDDICAIKAAADVDPLPFDPLAEVVLWLGGRRTFMLTRTAHGRRLSACAEFPRTKPPMYVVVREHRCEEQG